MGRDAAALTALEEAFVREYLVCLNATKAYERAGYKPGKDAHKRAGEVKRRPRVAEAIAKALAERAERFKPTQDRVIQELAALAFVKASDVATWTGSYVTMLDSNETHPEGLAAIASISATEHGPKFKLHDKAKPLQLLAEHLGLIGSRKPVEGEDVDGLIALAHLADAPIPENDGAATEDDF